MEVSSLLHVPAVLLLENNPWYPLEVAWAPELLENRKSVAPIGIRTPDRAAQR